MRRCSTAFRVYLLRSLMRLFGKERIGRWPFVIRAARPLEYHLDGFDGVRLHGWVRCGPEPDARVDIDVYVNGNFHKRFPACRHRPDIAAAHGTDGNHGFDIAIHHCGQIRSVSVEAAGYFPLTLGGFEGNWPGRWKEARSDGFKSSRLPRDFETPNPVIKRLIGESTLPDRLVLKRRSISAYVDHIRFLYRKDRTFPVHLSKNAYREYLRWYLVSEKRTGKPPVTGPQELSFLSAPSDIAPLPGLYLSNATKLFLSDYKTAFPLERDPVRQAENLLYWWCLLKLAELNVSGLIPASYIAFLNENASPDHTETRFIDTFARHNFRDFPIDTARPEERRLLFDRLSQIAAAVPQLRPLLPDGAMDSSQNRQADVGHAGTSHKSVASGPSVRLFGPLKMLSGLGQASRLSHEILIRNSSLC